ncbi:MAG: SDR family oxidoreductase [Actinomycetota bacterium]|nr:SDR family oxidoreductase [Actinomycetota bacterium]
MSIVLITGSSTGIGNLTAKALAAAGHTVYATMRDPEGRNAERAEALRETPKGKGDLRVVELDVTSQESADAAVRTVLDEAGGLDVVVNNAGHLVIGYAEAFTAEDLEHLFDINVFGVQRVNRAALPHMRERGRGTLLYVGSTIPITTPPFFGPYVASKAAFDALAVTTSYEVNPFGVETTIVMPGAFTQGTEHFPNASGASDQEVAGAYSALDPLVARGEEATNGLFPPGVDADPVAVAEEIARILALPHGEKPFRSVVDLTDPGVGIVEIANGVLYQARRGFVNRMGYGELLEVGRSAQPAPTP